MEYFETIEKARLLIDSGRNKEAIKLLQQQLSSDPDDAHIHALLSFCYSNLDRHKESVEAAHKALSISPDSSFNHYVLSLSYFGKGKYELSAKAIREAIAIDPEEDAYYYTLAANLYNQEKYKESLQAIAQGLAINPNNPDLLTLRSKCHVNTGNKEEAAKSIRQSLNEDPNSADGLATKGWISLDNHERKEAEQDFISSLMLDPENERAKEGLVEIYKLKSKVFNFFIKNSFKRIYYKRSWFLIVWVILCIKTIPIWIAVLSIYLLIGWYLSVLFNSFLRLGSRSKYLLSKKQILQSNIFIGLNSIIVLLGVAGSFSGIELFGKLALMAIAVLFMTLGTIEINSTSGRIQSLIFSIVLLGVLACILQYNLIVCTLCSVAFIALYGAGWSIRFRSE
ncbi:MAG: tetratricopeptide repeat protein [Cytophagaceae bacterium]